MNHWSFFQLKKLWNISYQQGVLEHAVCDYLRIIDLNQVKYEKSSKNVLFL